MPHRLEILDLTCVRGDRPLFEGLSQALSAGELLHVAGSNGSGKTTLLRALCGLSRPAGGDIRWGGKSIRSLDDEYRRDVAYVGHQDAHQGELTPIENLCAYRCLAGNETSATHSLPPATAPRSEEEALERLGIAAYRSFPSKILSQGQKRRLALARLLVVRKPLWILDEPFTALDTRSCQLITELLAEHLGTGGLVVLSSHQSFDMPSGVRRRVDLDAPRREQADLAETAAQAVAGGAPG